MNIPIRSITARSVLTNIATGLGKNAVLREEDMARDCTEFVLEIPEGIGQGSIRGVTFPSGVTLYRYDCLFRGDTGIDFGPGAAQPLKFMSCTAGNIRHSLSHGGQRMPLPPYRSTIVAGGHDTGHTLYFQGGTRAVLTSLEIDRPEFGRSHGHMDHGTSATLDSLLGDTASHGGFHYSGDYGPDTANMIRGQRDTKCRGHLRFMFLNGSSNILLAMQMQRFIDDGGDGALPAMLRAGDLENVGAAIEIITGDMGTSFSVGDLAARTGTNINKLQRGFRHLHQTTVNGYIHGLRMDRAGSLLKHSGLNISEIVTAIGLNSRSYFSKAFREAYGVTPTYFRCRKGASRKPGGRGTAP